MVSGDGLSDADTAPLQTNDGEIEMVNNFIYLGLVVSDDCDISEVLSVDWLRLPVFLVA